MKALFAFIEEAEKQEDREQIGKDLLELGEEGGVSSEKLEEAVKQLELKLERKPKEKPLKQASGSCERMPCCLEKIKF
ncbi:hypothetical protein [Paenibacillus sp. GCM10023250]|uniref:hypothetical protein n=1 Tax=Paenibacillus sp. GCM10023250 TaxID=3252648 RepID=UPI00361AE0C4